MASGGTLAPGDAVGTMNIAGNVSFAPGAVYRVGIEGAVNDKAVITSTATLGGTVSAQFAPGTYLPGTRYTILTANGGVSGSFAGVNQALSSLFITAELSYDADDVYLTLLRGGDSPVSFTPLGDDQQPDSRRLGTRTAGRRPTRLSCAADAARRRRGPRRL